MKRKSNPVAKALRSPQCRQKVIVDKKTVYNRKVRHPVAGVDIRF